MTVKRLSTGYWHVRLSLHQFAQWPWGELPTDAAYFGWWTEEQKRSAVALVAVLEGDDDCLCR